MPSDNWTRILPEPYCDDPEVAVMLIRSDMGIAVMRCGTEVVFVAARDATDPEDASKLRGLQIRVPETLDYRRTKDTFEAMDVRMVAVTWKGRLSKIPEKILRECDTTDVIVVPYHDWSEDLLLLNRTVAKITEAHNHKS